VTPLAAAERTELVIGTRGSKLALWQSTTSRTSWSASRASGATPSHQDTGDKILDVRSPRLVARACSPRRSKSSFCGERDLAVHSMKDVQPSCPKAASSLRMPSRVDPPESWSRPATRSTTLPKARSSARQSPAARAGDAPPADREVVDVRGNPRHGCAGRGGELAAVILAAAGITRRVGPTASRATSHHTDWSRRWAGCHRREIARTTSRCCT